MRIDKQLIWAKICKIKVAGKRHTGENKRQLKDIPEKRRGVIANTWKRN
jgi:hypothetical protein